MTTETTKYRWNSSESAAAYDEAAPNIHPCYVKVQDEILDLFPFGPDEPFTLVDIGGGSGRLVERVLERFAGAKATVVDQSEPFLALAERRLARFGARATTEQCRLQDWPRGRVSSNRDDRAENRVSGKLDYDVIVSTSAIHHLLPAEKQALYQRCFNTLAPGGMFINGDEYRPAEDNAYLALNEWWWAHMNTGLDDGSIPQAFQSTLKQWHDRNIVRFAEPKKSGDDCLQTATVQTGYLRDIGFSDVKLTWSEKLWGVLIAYKARA